MIGKIENSQKNHQVELVMRLDKWLWCARFFKTRQLASTAIRSGKATVNRCRAKPSRQITVGETLVIEKQGMVYEVEIRALSSQRLSAPLAMRLYIESPQSIQRREQQLELREHDRLSRVRIDRQKPDKRGRRLMKKFKRGSV